MFRNKTLIQLFMAVLILFIPMLLRAVSVNQIITLKKDGSGTMNFIYTEKESTIKGKNYIIGNLPFTKDKLEEYFSSPTNELFNSEVKNDEKDNSLIQVLVQIKFSDINKISDMKALSNVKLKLVPSDSGNVFTNDFTPGFLKANSVDQLYGVLEYDGKIKSTNGKYDGKNAIWFVDKDFIDDTQDIYYVATLEADNQKTTSGDKNEKDKSCGLFGFELPIIVLGGLLIFHRNRKKNDTKK